MGWDGRERWRVCVEHKDVGNSFLHQSLFVSPSQVALLFIEILIPCLFICGEGGGICLTLPLLPLHILTCTPPMLASVVIPFFSLLILLLQIGLCSRKSL